MDNTFLFKDGIPNTLPMLPKNPKHCRMEFIVTFEGHKQSVGSEFPVKREDIRPLLERLRQVLTAEVKLFWKKADIDYRMAEV